MDTTSEKAEDTATVMQRLPSAVKELAKIHPNNTWIKVPKDANLTRGWRDITYFELSQAVDGFSFWIEQTLGLGQRSVDVAAYIGSNDMMYAVAEIGLMQAGYQALLPSPRNSQEGQESLFKTTKCGILIHSSGVDSHVESIKEVLPSLRIIQIPSFDELVQRQAERRSPFSGLPSIDTDRVLILHTSGSTGLPKPIYHTHSSIRTITAARVLRAPEGRVNAHDLLLDSDRLLLSPCPFFHMMGQAILFRSIQCRAPLVILPPEKPFTGELIINVIKQTRPSHAIFPPSLLEQATETLGGMEALRSVEYVFYGGGPLATGIGDKLTEITTLISIIGSTEAGLVPCRLPEDRKDWKYFEWAPESGVDMEPDAEGLREMVIKSADKRYQGVFHTFPELHEWRTKDLFEQHPAKKSLWLYKGRKDDVLVLSNGEKFNPVGFEKTIESHPLVAGVIVVGQARFQTGLIIEPEWHLLRKKSDLTGLLDKVWPLVEQANSSSPAHGRVWRSKVAFTKPDKPFKRTPKGSIVRRQTVDLYQAEIDALYSNELSDDELGKLPEDVDVDTTKKFLRRMFKIKHIAIPQDVNDHQDLFNFGLDSLQVLALSTTLSHALGTPVSPRDIYGNPCINALAQFLSSKDGQSNGETTAPSQPSREKTMAQLVEKYTHNLSPSYTSPVHKARQQPHTYILTGSTGSLGNHILERLISRPSVHRVYCLNRSSSAPSRQLQSFQDRGVTSPNFSKVQFLTTDFSLDRFGLDADTYETLLRSTDVFIHNAWAVDFNKTLSTYEDTHIAGTRRVVDFALQAPNRKTHIVFISSIASVGAYPVIHPDQDSVPEDMFEDHRLPLPQGYGESKHVASVILAKAAEKAGIKTTVVRAGQLAGPSSGTGGEWNRHEWLPSIVVTSKAMGLVPERLGNMDVVDWVPMDLAAKGVVEISEANGEGNFAVAHLVNPQTVSWEELVPAVREMLGGEGKIRVVGFREWLDELKKASVEEVERKPGIKLVDFYEGLLTGGRGSPALATEMTSRMSETVKSMRAVDANLMGKWIGQWLKE